MKDPRIIKLAEILVGYSVKVKKGEKVLVECSDPSGLALAKEIWKLILLKNAHPYLFLGTEDLTYFFYKNASHEQLKKKPEVLDYLSSWMDKSIIIRACPNDRALSSIEAEKIILRQQTTKAVVDKMLKKPWVVTYYPTQAMAQSANMSLDELEDFYFQSCLQDWEKIGRDLQRIKKIFDNGEKVVVSGLKTNLSFSLKGRLAKVCSGEYNMPDGEIFCAPLDDTMEGEIYFDFPTLYSGKEVRDIHLKFKKGRVIEADASYNQDFLRKIIRTDKGASRIGEFAIGSNYGITKFMFNTLFDEKIGGTIHLALGRAYEEKEGGGKNQLAIHWDLVKDMRKKGSQVKINGKVILKDGKIF